VTAAMPELQVRLGSLTLPNPVLVAAGTFGYGVEFARAVRLERLGGLITKTLTKRPRHGNPPPRLVASSTFTPSVSGAGSLEASNSRPVPSGQGNRMLGI